MRSRSIACLVASSLLLACGDPPYEGLLEPPSEEDGLQLYMKVHVEPGQELTVCKNFAVPNGMFDIGRFEHAMTGTSHHLLTFPILLASTEVTDEMHLDCDENEEAQGDRIGFMYGTQSSTGELALPKGYAFPAMGGIAVQLEFHILNTGDEPFEAEAAVNLWKTREEIIGEAGTIFAFHDRIYVPPMATASTRQRCPVKDSMKLMNLVPHMHSRGIAMTVDLDHGGTMNRVLDVAGWDHDTVLFDPPLEIAAGDILDVQCHYNNPTAQHVTSGSSAKNDEMCVTGGLYYRDGPRLEIRDEVCWGEGIMYTGTQSCAQIEQCERAIDFSNWNVTPSPGLLYNACVVSGCQAGATAFAAYDTCRWQNCRPMCFADATDDGHVSAVLYDTPECMSCVQQSCAAQRDACPTATCN
jgi:hypothetical protein